MCTLIQHTWIAWLLMPLWPIACQQGFFWGSILPDVDIYVGFVMILLGYEKQAIAFHRSLTHSVLGIAVTSLLLGHVATGPFVLGFLLGHILHVLLDLVFWFWFVDLFWPLHYWFSWAAPINLWSHLHQTFIEKTGLWLELTDCVLFFVFFHFVQPSTVRDLVLLFQFAWGFIVMLLWPMMEKRYFFAMTHCCYMFIQLPAVVWVTNHHLFT